MTTQENIQTLEVFTADHGMLVMDMILKGYTVGVQVGIHNVNGETERTTFWSYEHQADYILIGTTFYMSNGVVDPSEIKPVDN